MRGSRGPDLLRIVNAPDTLMPTYDRTPIQPEAWGSDVLAAVGISGAPR
jgi:hypothetical protein